MKHRELSSCGTVPDARHRRFFLHRLELPKLWAILDRLHWWLLFPHDQASAISRSYPAYSFCRQDEGAGEVYHSVLHQGSRRESA